MAPPTAQPPSPTVRGGSDRDAWSLFAPTGREASDRRTFEELLRRWTEGRVAAGQDPPPAGLYGDLDGAATLIARTGDGELPARLDAAVTPAGWQRIDFPDGLLLHRVAGEVDRRDDCLQLLAAGLCVRALKRRLQEHSFQAKFRGVELEALYEVGLAIAATLELEELSEEVLLRAVSLLDARRGALYLLEGDRYRLLRTIAGEARPELAADDAELERLLAGPVSGSSDLLPGSRHVLAVPVEIEGDPRGLLIVADKESRRGVGPFPATDRRTLSLFANQAAIAIENAKLHRLALEKERLEREMELAAEIQQQLLPDAMPAIPGYEVLGWNRPARQVGGDYFDVQDLGDGRWWLVVGDVTGKGMPAALMVSTLHSGLRLLVDRFDVGPELVGRLNRHVYEATGANKFITLLIARLDAARGRLGWVNAGHNPGLLCRAAGGCELLGPHGLPLGLLPGAEYGSAGCDLEPGDLVCLYSDGITECEGPDEEELGMERLADLLRQHRDEPLADIVRAIDETVVDFAAGRPQGDDQTVVLLRRRP